MAEVVDETVPSRAESWRAGGWPDVLHAFAAAPEEASDDLRNAATAIMDSVARALEASDDERHVPSSSCWSCSFRKTLFVMIVSVMGGL